MRHFLIPLLICVVALAGCSSRKYVRSSVDSRTVDQAKVSPSAISIEAAPADGKNPLEHEEYRGLLARALESKGWTVVKSGSSVPYLKFAYKVDGGKVVGSTSYTFSSASASRSGGSIQAMGNSWETSSALISYNRYLGLRAYDAQGRVWWSVDVGSDGYEGNLRNVMPYLTVAGAGWAGRPNQQTKTTVVRDEEVSALFPEKAQQPKGNPWEKAKED